MIYRSIPGKIAYGAHRFGGTLPGMTDVASRINIPHASDIAITELTPFSALLLARVMQLGSTANRVWSKNGTDGNGGPFLFFSGTASLIEIAWRGMAASTTNAQAISNNVVWKLNEWLWIGMSYQPGASQECRIFTARLHAQITEVGYAAGGTNHSGTSASTALLAIGNNAEASGQANAFQGDIAFFSLFMNRIYAARDFELIINAYENMSRTTATIWMPLGDVARNGRVRDLSIYGHHGIVEGAIPVAASFANPLKRNPSLFSSFVSVTAPTAKVTRKPALHMSDLAVNRGTLYR